MRDDSPRHHGALRRSIISSAAFIVLLVAITFLPGGFGWRRGWLFFAIFVGFCTLGSLYLWRVNPEIFVARSKIHAGTKSWDKVLLVLILGAFFALFVVAGLDARFGWSSVPMWAIAMGYILFTLGFAMSIWVYAVNKFAEPSVRIQSDRAQKVVETGPYSIVRHPLYVAAGGLVVGMALALGSYWAFIPVGVGGLVIIVRTALEDRMLRDELAGYRDYASRVRYRLIPGIW
jgi:protein-S-isoprenylcysteine O-methyltransferase Ste14